MSDLCFIVVLMLRHWTVSFHPICVYIIFSVPCSSQSFFIEEVWLLQDHLVFLLLWSSSCCCHVSSRARTLLSAGILRHNKHVSKCVPLLIDTGEILRADTCFYYHEDSACAFMVFILFHLLEKLKFQLQLSFFSAFILFCFSF